MNEPLVSPLATGHRPHTPAAALMLRGQHVLLVDQTLQENTGWGRALLSGANRVLAEVGAITGNERRKPLGSDGAPEWAVRVQEQHFVAAVIAGGD